MTHSYDAATVQRLVDCNVTLTHDAGAENGGIVIEMGYKGGYAVYQGDEAAALFDDFPSAFAAWLAACGLDAPQLEFQPDWNNAPEEADWWAMNEDYGMVWYKDEPASNAGLGLWQIRTFPARFWPDHTDYGDAITDVDWRTSLRRRPEVIRR